LTLANQNDLKTPKKKLISSKEKIKKKISKTLLKRKSKQGFSRWATIFISILLIYLGDSIKFNKLV
jgi:hypothetical protein